MNLRRSPAFIFALLLLTQLAAVTRAAELQPSHQCLPEETVLVIRAPEALKFIEAFREQTKLGSVLLSPQRFEGVVNLIREQAAEGLTEFTEGLAKYNLKIEDFPKLFHKELGFALVVEPRRGQYPLAIGLTWAEPEGDLGERLVNALTQLIEETKDDPDAPRRVDFDVDGNSVMHLTFKIRGPETLPDADDEGDDEPEEVDDQKLIDVDQMHVFIARVGDRLLMANTFPQSETEVRAQLNDHPDRPVDLTTLSGADTVQGVFARFLTAHTGTPVGLTPRVMATPGVAAALPEGVPLVEVLFSAEPLLKLAADAEDQTATRVLKTLGLDRIGPAALRVALDRGALRTGLFLSAAEPRQGLLALLDQPTFVADPPQWVPASVMSFGQLSFDLGKAYKLLREVLISEGGDQMQTMLGQLEQQVSGFTQTDLPTLLSSVGQNHYFVTLPPTMAKIAPDSDVEAPTSRQGFVWQLKDEAPWKRIIQLGAGFAALSQGALTAGEEQGFVGLRLNVENTVTGGLFVGHGHMILGIGPDVLEPLMSSIRTPPEGAGSLRGGDLVRRANAIMAPEAGIYYQVTDFDRYIKSLRQTILSLFDLSTSLSQRRLQMQLQLGENEPTNEELKSDEEGAKLTARIKELLPRDEELEGTTGVSVGQLIINQHGLTYRNALELPPQ